MTDSASESHSRSLVGINPGRLFLGSCIALISTAVSFAVIGAIMGALKAQFVLTNQDVGYIAGAATWGFTISIVVLGPLCDALGMKRLLWFAFLCHLVGPIAMMLAPGFWGLFWGALVLSLGNGTVEAVCNPLVATIYPDRKTQKLNQFHVWFPGGIVIGGLGCYLLDKAGIGDWRVKLGLILIPTVIYGILFIGQKAPATERVQSGVSFSEMFRATLLRPLFLILFFCMALTASLELGPNRWIPSILEAGGIAGILVLVWINGIMGVMRFFAGPVVHRLSPIGLLFISSLLAGAGLYWLSYAESTAMAFTAATVFALGVCYFWPTMLGVVAERVPRGGALALALMGGMGMMAVGLITTPMMGTIADRYLPAKLPAEQTREVLASAATALEARSGEVSGKQAVDIRNAAAEVQKVLAAPTLPHPETANALRAVIGSGLKDPSVDQAKALLNPADNYGGRMSFRWITPAALLLALVFGSLYIRDKAAGGYRAERISRTDPEQNVEQRPNTPSV